jgi:hypothetical protein
LRNRLIGIAIGVSAALIALLLLSGDRRPPRYALLEESDGSLRVVAVQYTRAAAPYTRPCLQAFIRAAGPDVRVIAVCGDAGDADAARRDLGLGIETVVVGKPITGWCKDRFLVGEGSVAPLIRPPVQPTGMGARDNDSLVSGALARALPDLCRDVEVPLKFDAGDILPAGKKLLVSDTLWAKNGKPSDFLERLRAVFSEEVLWLRGAPDHHIGMYAAPLANGVVVVGDPDLARPCWSSKLEDAYGKADFSAATVATFHHAAEQLEAAGYRVVRVPLTPIGPQTFISYTNGVFERDRVFMPWYGIPELDDAARAAYEAQGLAVFPIPVKSVYRFHGTIGCLVNVLARG